MKTLMLFCSALIIGLSSTFSPSQAREGGYGGFSQENMQEFNGYINDLEMIKVQADEELDQAIDAVPINLETAIGLDQERGLRDWLRQYLIAFSESGNDSLAAAFYLRAGFNKERYIAQNLKWINFARENARNPSVIVQSPDGTILTEEEIEKSSQKKIDNVKAKAETALKEGALPLFRSMHKDALRNQNKEYFIENISFQDSGFRVFELEQETPTFLLLASDQGMLPKGYTSSEIGLSDRLPALLEAGEKIICADILFIVEESLPLELTSNPVPPLPPEFTPIAPNPGGPKRTPSFFRLMWDQDKKIWRHLEVFHSSGVGVGVVNTYFFNLL